MIRKRWVTISPDLSMSCWRGKQQTGFKAIWSAFVKETLEPFEEAATYVAENEYAAWPMSGLVHEAIRGHEIIAHYQKECRFGVLCEPQEKKLEYLSQALANNIVQMLSVGDD